MADSHSATHISTSRLILVPAALTLAVTLLRLVGELQHWSKVFFNASAGGGGALVRIACLPLIFGPYFALKLVRASEGPTRTGRAVGYALLGLLGFVAGGALAFAPQLQFPGKILVGLLLIAGAAGLQLLPWPAFGKVLLAYGYAARVPVAIVMFFAIRGEWGTHYDALPPGYNGPMSLWPKYMMIGVVPQLVFWVAYTVIVGALLGTVVTAIVRRVKPAPQAAS